jgi:hypothetical protein
MTELTEKELFDAITQHPTMRRLTKVCDSLERVLKRKAAGVPSEPDSEENTEASETSGEPTNG